MKSSNYYFDLFSEVDKASLFDGGPKSLMLVGFIKQSEIPIHLVLGEGSMVFQPIEGNEVLQLFNIIYVC